MKLTLRRAVTVERWRVIATLGLAQKRPELIAILALANERPGGVVTGLDVSRSLLAGRPAMVGERLLEVCRMMSLVELDDPHGKAWRLTAAGRRALASEEVPAPQRGEFDVWMLADPLYPEVIVRVLPTERDRRAKPDERGEERPARVEELPILLRQCKGKVVRLPLRKADEPTEVFVFDLAPLGRHIEREQGELSIELAHEGGTARFKVSFDGRPATFAPGAGLPSLRDAMAAGPTTVEPPVNVAFRTLSDNERRTGRREFDIEGYALPSLGEFRSARFSDVPLAPKSQQDADEWAVWRLLDGIRGYVWPRDFEKRVRAVREVAVEEQWAFDPSIPTQVEMAQKRPDQPALVRSLLVPLDWQSPESVPAPVLILSGRASLARHGRTLVEQWGDAVARVYVLEPADAKAADAPVTSELGKRAVARRVRQPADVWVRIEPGGRVGQRWHPAPRQTSKAEKAKTAPSEDDGGEWKDVPEAEVARMFEDLRLAFWDQATQELQLDAGWLAVKPATR